MEQLYKYPRGNKDDSNMMISQQDLTETEHSN